MDRKNCTHQSKDVAIGLVTWCARCSGWRYKRVGVDSRSSLADASSVVYESHFLPAEETTPDTILAIASRLFRCAQEWEQDSLDHAQLDIDWGGRTS